MFKTHAYIDIWQIISESIKEMPRHYFQCSKCKRPFTTRTSSTAGTPTAECCGIKMTYRGAGMNARENWPHGRPKQISKPEPKLEAEIVIYTDGACEPNPGSGGWAAILQYIKNNELHEKEISNGVPNTTNNRMEMTAVLESLKILKRPYHVVVYTDSKYVQQGIGDWKNGEPGHNKGWMVGWKANGWERSTGPLINPDLWLLLYEEVKRHKSVKMKHVRGHNGNVYNERCDQLAVKARLTIV